MNLSYSLVLTIVFIYKCNSARILGIVHIPAYSHQQLGIALFTELAVRGHDVTVLTPVIPKKIVDNMKVIQLKYPAIDNGKLPNMFDLKTQSIFQKIAMIEFMGLEVAGVALNLTEIQTLLSSGTHFDAVIIEQFVNDAFKGICYHFHAPCITISTVAPNRWSNRQMGNPLTPSYMPELFSGYSNRMTFLQRCSNMIIFTVEQLFFFLYLLPKQNELLQKHFPGAPHIYDLYYNTSLMLVNTHVATNFPVPLVPNMIPVGGYHISPPKKLPQDLQEYLDNAKDGAVYFSMGSNLKIQHMTQDKINAFVNVFKNLKQKIFWKIDGANLSTLPSNVKVSAWFPQQEILAHPNVQLFITHGGLLSTMEAIYHGVPVIAIPIYGDQEMNAANAENGGYAVVVTYEDLNQDNLQNAVNSVLTNPRYQNNARQRSKIFHDDPIKPIDKAVFWVEYVIRHQGAPHLRTAALNLHWYQYLLLDVILFITVFMLGIILTLKKLINTLFKKDRSKNAQKVKSN